MQIPWTQLGTQQVVVELDRIYILAVPNYMQTDKAPDVSSAEEEDALLEKRKKDLVDALERAWVDSIRSQTAQQAEPGRVQAYINTILGNLKLTVCFFSGADTEVMCSLVMVYRYWWARG